MALRLLVDKHGKIQLSFSETGATSEEQDCRDGSGWCKSLTVDSSLRRLLDIQAENWI